MTSRRTVHQRTVALSLASALTFGPLIAFHFRSPPSTTENEFERVSYLSLLPARSIPTEPTVLPSQANTRPPNSLRKGLRVAESISQSAMPLPESPPSEAAQPIPAADAEAPEQPEPSASAPIKLDLATIRAANRASKSDARNLAESSGAYFGDEALSKTEQLANAIERTGKEDCIGPNAGGSILSVFVIAYMAARDKCK